MLFEISKIVAMNLIRTFVAIKIPVGNVLTDVWNELRGKLGGNQVKWVSPDFLHLTLFFLGDTPEDQIPNIGIDLKNVLAAQNSFEVELKGLGYFGSHLNPKVIWVGIERCIELTRVKRDVTRVISSYGFLDDQRSFDPHITLGRIKHILEPQILPRMMHGYANFIFQKTKVSSVIHYKSELRPTGPIYTPINEFFLKKESDI